MKDLSPIVDKFNKSKIVVLGDFVVDEYIFGTTRRISRDEWRRAVPAVVPVFAVGFTQTAALGHCGSSAWSLDVSMGDAC